MKQILLVISLILLSCGTRTKQTEKIKTETSSSSDIYLSENLDVKSSSEVKTDLSNYLKQSGLKINSTGNPYTLQYGSLIFSGDANLDFSNTEEKTVIKTVRKEEIAYKSQLTHKSLTHHKTIYHKKTSDLKSVRDSWWLYILIGLVSIGVWELIKYLFKKYNPLQYLKI